MERGKPVKVLICGEYGVFCRELIARLKKEKHDVKYWESLKGAPKFNSPFFPPNTRPYLHYWLEHYEQANTPISIGTYKAKYKEFMKEQAEKMIDLTNKKFKTNITYNDNDGYTITSGGSTINTSSGGGTSVKSGGSEVNIYNNGNVTIGPSDIENGEPMVLGETLQIKLYELSVSYDKLDK